MDRIASWYHKAKIILISCIMDLKHLKTIENKIEVCMQVQMEDNRFHNQ